MATVAGHGFEVFILRIAAGDFGNLSTPHPLEEPAIEFLVDSASLRRSHPMRDSAGADEGDALVLRPSLNACADERANVEAALGCRHRRRESIYDHRYDRNIPARRQMN